MTATTSRSELTAETLAERIHALPERARLTVLYAACGPFEGAIADTTIRTLIDAGLAYADAAPGCVELTLAGLDARRLLRDEYRRAAKKRHGAAP